MSKNALPSEQAAIVACIDPDANAAGALTSDWVAVKDFEKFMAIVMAGTFGSSGTLAFKLQEATDGSGTGAQDITGKAATTLTDAGSDSDKQAIINLDANEVSDGFTHVAMVMTTATATGDSAAIMLGFNPKYGPASDSDLASVDEIVT